MERRGLDSTLVLPEKVRRIGTMTEERRLELLKVASSASFTHQISHDKDYWFFNDGKTHRYLKLQPGGYIHRHTDKAGWRHFYVLQTNPDSLFYVEGEEYHLDQGGIYEMDGRLEHWAVNNGDCDRINFIDLKVTVGG